MQTKGHYSNIRTMARVILIGNGTSVLDNPLGQKVDEFDTVVRFNSFKTIGLEEFTGKRTDIWVTCVAHNKHMKNINDFKRVIVHSWTKRANECLLFKKIKDKRTDAYKIENGPINRLVNKGVKDPSTGLIAIEYFLETNAEVYLHGFDWWDRERHHYADSEKRGTLHKPQLEYKVIKEFGDRLKFLK